MWLTRPSTGPEFQRVDGLGEVLPQVEPVGDLDRLRCPGPGAV
jgi:hypothetical protein